MKKVEVDLEVTKLKKEGIRKTCEQVNAKASSMVMMCLQWGDLERHFDGVQKELEVALEKNTERERSLDERAMSLDQKERRLCVLREEIRRKQLEMGIVEETDEGCYGEMGSEGTELAMEGLVVPLEGGEDNVCDSVKEEVKSKGDVLASLESCIEQCCKQLDLKRQEMETVQISLSGKSRELESREHDLVRVGFRLEFQQEELNRVEKYAQERRDEVQRVEKELASLCEEIRGKEKELNRVKRSIGDCLGELGVKESLLQLIEQQIKEYSEELVSLKPSGKELSKDLVLNNGVLSSVPLDIEKHIVQTEENNKQPAKRKSIGEEKVTRHSKRARNGSIVPVEQECGSHDVNPGYVSPEIRIINCPDPEFSDFEKLRSHFAVNQFWACYDDDMMPRSYARIDKVLSPDFRLIISWLRALPESQAEYIWSEKELPIACGNFAFGETEETENPHMFSHLIQCENFPHRNLNYCVVYPREGETWAIFKNWDMKWSYDPERHRPYRYDYVEILSDFDEDSGATVAYLCKVKGFVALFQRVAAGNAVADAFCHILPDDKYRFSHRIPSFKMTGKERANVPSGSFELDPSGLNLDNPMDDRKKERKYFNDSLHCRAWEKVQGTVRLRRSFWGEKTGGCHWTNLANSRWEVYPELSKTIPALNLVQTRLRNVLRPEYLLPDSTIGFLTRKLSSCSVLKTTLWPG